MSVAFGWGNLTHYAARLTSPYRPGFLAYSSCLLAMLATLILHSAPRHGHSNVFVYATITALVGSLSIMAAKVWQDLSA